MSFMDEDGWYKYNDNGGCTVPVFGKKELFNNDDPEIDEIPVTQIEKRLWNEFHGWRWMIHLQW